MKENTLHYLGTSVVYLAVSVMVLGLLYPLVMTGVAELLFPQQAGGSLIDVRGRPIGSAIIGQAWTSAAYFHGRPSAAGKGYDPTATGATNFGPTNAALIKATRAALERERRENPEAPGPVPADLVMTSASGIDPDISPEAAYFQVPRVAKARHLSVAFVRALVAAHIRGRTLGILGEPRVNVLELNRALSDSDR
jgi:K+-transporting ATPase ATPase C chain